MIVTIVVLFLIGYLAIALERQLRVDKSAIALLLGMLLWVVYTMGAAEIVPNVSLNGLEAFVADSPHLKEKSLAQQCLDYVLNVQLVESLGEIIQTILFLIGAMTIVELIDVHGGFSVITDKIRTRNKKKLLWVVCITTFIFSAILDNMTTSIVMIMLLRKLIANKRERWIYTAMIVISANAGGAWSPIGDVTTIMLWVKGNVTAGALISYVLLPSIVSLLVPLFIVSRNMKGKLPKHVEEVKTDDPITRREKKTILLLGVIGLLFVPVFKSITHMPPFVGILFVLGVLWTFTECFYNGKRLDLSREQRLPKVIARIDMPSILFFLGILMAVSVLQVSGILDTTSTFLDEKIHNIYVIDTLLGMLSSVVDNVPLVAGVMGMYPVELIAEPSTYAANFMVDGAFWEFLSYCAGVGGNLLIIGSAAGVIAMGLDKISFGWYLRKFTGVALIGYLSGALVYIIEVWLLK